MKNKPSSISEYLSVMINPKAYLNLIYVMAAFPLGVIYAVTLISGLSLGISLVVIWIGIPVLLVVGIAIWMFTIFERFLTMYILKEEIPSLSFCFREDASIWTKVKNVLSSPIPWKSSLYLILKFPLGLATFVVLIPLICLTIAFLTMPLSYELMQTSYTGIYLNSNLPVWTIDTMGDALLISLVGLILWPVTLHVSNGLAWGHAKFAKLMLSEESIGEVASTT
jgi:hypothetical protein